MNYKEVVKRTRSMHIALLTIIKPKKPRRCINCEKVLNISARKGSKRCSKCSDSYAQLNYRRYKNEKRNSK